MASLMMQNLLAKVQEEFGTDAKIVHVSKAIDETCDHDWVDADGKDNGNPEYCSKCHLSFTRYIHCCCP